MIDKPFESFTTYIHEFSNSFSAYRYKVFDNEKGKKSILEDLFL